MGGECRLLALVANDDLFQCQTTGSWRKHGHGHGYRLRLWRSLWHGHRLWLWFWLPIRQTHKIFLHRLVTHEFGSTQTETSRAKNATWRSSSPTDQMPQQCSSVANLFPVRPGVTLLFVFLSSEGFHAKALRALVADGDFRKLATHIANVVCVFGLGVGSQGNYLHALPPF